ncbi:hypothetical protein ABW20_dc0108993 [Dactylellina cionopaga]|nr:hypothetical protein ABW20_dc0108993 [Dactylellina cionopaga]
MGHSVKRLIQTSTDDHLSGRSDRGFEDQPGLLPLCLALHLEKPRREDMLRVLLRSGASCGQRDASGVPALLRVIQSSDADALKIIFEEDGASALTTARTVYDMKQGFTDALTIAIIEGHEEQAMFLLQKGVPPEITERYAYNLHGMSPIYRWYYQEPAELALEAEMPDIFVKCIENGAEPSRLTGEQMKITLLDFIEEKFQDFWSELEEMPKELVDVPPEYSIGSYEYYMASHIVNEENEKRKDYNMRLCKCEVFHSEAVRERKERLRALLNRYKVLAKWLIEQGGKTFAQLNDKTSTSIMGFTQTVQTSASIHTFEGTGTGSSLPENTALSETYDRNYPEEPNFRIEFPYHNGKEHSLSKIYHELFKAVWNGSIGEMENIFSQYPQQAIDSPVLDLATKNQLGHNLLSIAIYRQQPKELLDFIRNKATQQKTSLEEVGLNLVQPAVKDSTSVPEYTIYAPPPEAREFDIDPVYIPKSPWGIIHKQSYGDKKPRNLMSLPYHSKLVQDENIKALEEQIEQLGLQVILHQEIIEEILPQEGPRGTFPALSGPFRSPMFLDGDLHLPLALLAAYHGSHKVYDWLLTDGPEKALRKHYAVAADEPKSESTKIYQEINSKQRFFLKTVQIADSGTIKRWLGTNHPLTIHIACMKRLEDGYSDNGKIEWYQNNLRFFISRLGEKFLEASSPHGEGITPLLTAAKIRNKWAIRALISVGAKVDCQSSAPGHIPLNNVSLGQDFSSLGEEYLSMVFEDHRVWGIPKQPTADSNILPMTISMGYHMKAPKLGVVANDADDISIGFLDPQGKSPIHVLVNDLNSAVEELQVVLDAVDRPETLMKEDKNGMTPLDLATMNLYRDILSTRIRKIPITGGDNSKNPCKRRSPGKSIFINGYRPISDEEDLKLRHEDWGTEEGQSGVVQKWIMIAAATKRALKKVEKQRILLPHNLKIDEKGLKNYTIPEQHNFISLLELPWRDIESGKSQKYAAIPKLGYHTRQDWWKKNVLIWEGLVRKQKFPATVPP